MVVLRINRYCKFFIYLWSIFIWGAYLLVAALFLLAPLFYTPETYESSHPRAALFLVGGFITLYGLALAFSIWLAPTIVLLIFGLLAAPKEEEDQSDIGKQAFLIAIFLVIFAVGLLFFITSLQSGEDRTTSFAILGVTMIFGLLVLSPLLFRKGECDEEELEIKETIEERGGYKTNYCPKCGAKVSLGDKFCKNCGKIVQK